MQYNYVIIRLFVTSMKNPIGTILPLDHFAQNEFLRLDFFVFSGTREGTADAIATIATKCLMTDET